MDRKKYAFDKINLILTLVGMAAVIIGFVLMSGPATTMTEFQPDIFSTRRIVIAPAVSLFGFLFIIYAIMRKPRD